MKNRGNIIILRNQRFPERDVFLDVETIKRLHVHRIGYKNVISEYVAQSFNR